MNASCSILMTVAVLVIAIRTAKTVDINYHPNNIHETIPRQEDVVCSGWKSNMGLSLSGSFSHWYNGMRDHFTNCTYVSGNLLITWLMDKNINYDMDFLRDIRYVRGYVLIAVANYHGDLPLLNLEIIRGNTTFSFRRERQLGLAVLLTNFTRIRMPKLKEISNGNVFVTNNRPDLRIEVSRDWDTIMRGRANTEPNSLHLQDGPLFNQPASSGQDMCSPICPRRCFRSGSSGCCHPQCAGGCRGPGDTQCEACKDYELRGECVSHCPVINQMEYFHYGSQCYRPPPVG